MTFTKIPFHATMIALTASIAISGCSKPEQSTTPQSAVEIPQDISADQSNNPFFESWNTPFGAPPFGEIETKHYAPAFEKAMQMHIDEIQVIADADSVPTFDNTLAEMERAGSALGQVRRVFSNVAITESNEELQSLQRELFGCMDEFV